MKPLLSTLLILSLFILVGCKTTRTEKQVGLFRRIFSKPVYPLPVSFDDSVKIITERLKSKNHYVMMVSKEGHCFGQSRSGNAKFVWSDQSTTIYFRVITKEAQEKRCVERNFSIENSDLFKMFNEFRIDTIQQMPKGEVFIDPATMVTLTIKSGDRLFKNEFESWPFFNSKDTTNLLYIFVNKFNTLSK